MSSSPRPAARRSSPPARPLDLFALSDQALLGVRLCQLGLRLPGSQLEARAAVLYDELAQRGIEFRPHMWLSTDWFSPDEVPGFAIPFYLAHPRLLALETQQMGLAEGGTERNFLQLMRHEAGHALDSGYRLHERPEWRALFGPFNAPYHRHYRPKPHSKSFVRHLDNWYAQSHPAEDFAETLAVWLDPASRWRSRYRDWPALEKLSYVNRLMREIGPAEPLVRCRELVEPISSITITLGAYYEEKRRRYHLNRPQVYDGDLKQLFHERKPGQSTLDAPTYLRRARPEIRKLVANSTGAYQYDIDRVFSQMIKRSSKLNLVVARDEDRPNSRHARRVAAQLEHYLAQGHHQLAR